MPPGPNAWRHTARNSTAASRRSVKSSRPACVDALRVLSPDRRQRLPRYGALPRPHGAWRRTGTGLPRRMAVDRRHPRRRRAAGDHRTPCQLWKSPNGKAITPFLQTLAAVARRLPSREQMQHYLDLTLELMERTTGSIHGIHKSFASPGLPDFLAQAPTLLNSLAIGGLQNWVDYGIRNYPNHPERQRAYFSLQSADSRAVLQRERHGTLLVDNERLLDLYLRGLWGDSAQLVPYASSLTRRPAGGCVCRCSPTTTRPEFACPTSSTTPRAFPASTATARPWRTSPATAAGAHRCSPTTSARCSAWRSRSSKTAASKR
jgi:hypothetical protein